MSNILFLYNNIFDDATLTASSEASGFPCENTQHPFITKVWRTAGATAGTATLKIDHGSAKAVTCIALAGYNWTSAPGTLDLEFDDAADFSSIDHTESLTWAANPTTNGNKGVIIKTFASQSYRYNRLNVVYSPGGSPTDWDLGRIFLGTYFEPTIQYISDGIEQSFVDASYINKTAGGQEHVDEVTIYRQKAFSFIISTQAQWELFQKMINHVGKTKDMFIAFDYDNEPDELTWYGKLTAKLPAMGRLETKYFKLDCEFKESN